MNPNPRKLSDGQIAEIVARRGQGQEYKAIASYMNKTYGLEMSAEAVRMQVRNYGNLGEVSAAVADIHTLKESARVKRLNSLKVRENRTLLDAINNQEDLLEQIGLVANYLRGIKVPKISLNSEGTKKPTTVELMISDLHIGKLTKDYNVAVAKERLKTYMAKAIKDIQRHGAFYKVEKIIVFLGGDLFENSLMHREESLAGCEFQNPHQLYTVIETIMTEVMIPLAGLDIATHFVCVTGNHCRQDTNKTYQLPGKNHLSWTIYQTLRLFSEHLSTHFTWDIPEGVNAICEIYGTCVLYTHGDLIGQWTKHGFNSYIGDVAAQLNRHIHCLRVGHRHEDLSIDAGRIIANASLCGQDSYSETKGYNSKPGMFVNYYVPNDERPTSFFHSFLIQL